MAIGIHNNLSSMSAHRQSLVNQKLMQATMRQLSSGYRINSAKDDPAGLAISEKMRAQYTAYERAMMNAQDGASMAQVAEGALDSVHSMLNRLTELSTQAANGTLGASERSMLNAEAKTIMGEIDRVSKATNFNGVSLLDGSLSSAQQVSVGGVNSQMVGDSLLIGTQDFTVFDGTNGDAATFQVDGKNFMLADSANYAAAVAQFSDSGVNVIQVSDASSANFTAGDLGNIASVINSKTGQNFQAVAGGVAMETGKGLQLQVGETSADFNKITVSVGNMSSKGLGLSGLDLSTQEGASQALEMISSAREKVSATRGDLGSTMNRLDSTYNNLAISNENIQAAESRIRDADMAKLMMDYTKRSMLQQVSMSMMAKGNMQQQQLLQLLR